MPANSAIAQVWSSLYYRSIRVAVVICSRSKCCTRVERKRFRDLRTGIIFSVHAYGQDKALYTVYSFKKGSPYSITERRVPELIPVLGSQPAGDVSHKPGGRLPLLSARPAVSPATLNRAATNFAAWWTEAQWVWTVCLRLLPDRVATVIWTRALLRLSRAR